MINTTNQKQTSQVYYYGESAITFNTQSGVMVNATEMAKPFGKNATHWLRNQQTKDFINELSALRNRKGSELVIIENGIGCYMHEDVAIEFARWLSPKFAIWCNDRIKELLKGENAKYAELSHSYVKKTNRLLEAAASRMEHATRVIKELREEVERLQRPKAVQSDEYAALVALVKKYVRASDKRMVAELAGCSISHVRKVASGYTVSRRVMELLAQVAKDNAERGVCASEPRQVWASQLLFTESSNN